MKDNSVSTTMELPAEAERIDAVDRRLVWGLGALLLAVTALVFHRVVGFELLTWDDDQHITNNKYYNPLSWPNLFHFWTYSYIYLYIPISYWFFGAEAWLAEQIGTGDPAVRFNPAVFHVGNLLLHLGCVLLTYRLLLRLVRHAPAAFAGTLLFAIHPLQGEAVAWVSETRGTLATLFSLLALHRYLDFVGVDPERGIFVDVPYGPPRRRAKDFGMATIYFALALLSKPSATAWPLVVAVVEIVLLRQPWKPSLRRMVPWFIMAAVIFGLTKYYQKTELVHHKQVASVLTRPLVAGDAYAFYLRKLVWPGETSFDYGRTTARAAASPWFHVLWLVPVAVAALLALDRQNRRVLLGGYLIFLLALAPVSGLVPFLFQSISTVADRYAYVPLIGLALTTAAWVATRPSSEAAFALVVALLAFAAPITYRQSELWRDDQTVYGQGLHVNPQSFMGHLHLGNCDRAAGRLHQAISHYEQVLKIRPDLLVADLHIGGCFYNLQQYDDAVRTYQQALNRYPSDRDALCGLGRAYVAQKKWPEAERAYQQAGEADPESAEPQIQLGEAYLLLKRHADADRIFAAAFKLDDSADAHLRYGRALASAERYADALPQLEQALERDPKLAAAHYETATVYWRQGKFAPAIAAAERARELRPRDFGTLQTLGLALAAVGKTDEARTQLEAALTLVAPASPQATAIRATLSELSPKE